MKTKLLRLNIGIKISDETVSIKCFANDFLMIIKSEFNIQNIGDEINEMFKSSEINK